MLPATKIIRKWNKGTHTWKIGDVLECVSACAQRCDSRSTGCTVLPPCSHLCSALLRFICSILICCIVPWHAISCDTMSCPALHSHSTLFHNLSCPLPCPALLSPLLSYFVLSCFALLCSILITYIQFSFLHQFLVEKNCMTYARVLAECSFPVSQEHEELQSRKLHFPIGLIGFNTFIHRLYFSRVFSIQFNTFQLHCGGQKSAFWGPGRILKSH